MHYDSTKINGVQCTMIFNVGITSLIVMQIKCLKGVDAVFEFLALKIMHLHTRDRANQ